VEEFTITPDEDELRFALGPVGFVGIAALLLGLFGKRKLLILLGAVLVARDPKGPFRR
jgi:hypothetical protein